MIRARTITDGRRLLNLPLQGARRSLLLVHGRDCKPSADTLLELCRTALATGLERDYPEIAPQFADLHCELAYYGDLNNALLAGDGRRYDEALDVGDRRRALTLLGEIPARKRFGIRQYDRLPGKSALGEAIADLCAPLFGALGMWLWLCRRRAPDFAQYLERDSEYSEATRERLRRRLTGMLDRGDRIMLVTHGTGSAIAWDVLWELSHDPELAPRYREHKIEHWITLGSPLGDRALRKHLAGGDRSGVERFPCNIIAWHNVSAEDDYTCHDKTLADDMKQMLAERLVSSVDDYKIYNHAVRYGRSNPHSSVGYLIHPRMSKLVADWLTAN